MSALLDPGFWRGRRVLLTGHTGFKGSWLAMWLGMLGARVHGFALPPEPGPSLANAVMPPPETLADLRDASALARAVEAVRPEIVLHLAAQALVGRGWRDPQGTFDANVVGTLALLAAVRHAPDLRAVVVVTSDKVYRNDDTNTAFPEDAALGGDDPYSASKAAAEMLIPPLRQAWFDGVGVGTARAGNVIGGGDVGEERLLPDAWRAAQKGESLVLRRPDSTRPWQHVFDCLTGYLLLAEALAHDPAGAPASLNFGPSPQRAQASARHVAERFFHHLGRGSWQPGAAPPFAEKNRLALDPSRAMRTLGWRVRLDLEASLELTAAWARAHDQGADMQAFSQAQLTAFAGVPARA